MPGRLLEIWYAIYVTETNISFSGIAISNFVLNSTEFDARLFDKKDQETQVELESALFPQKFLELKG